MALPFGAHVRMPNTNPSPLSFGFGFGLGVPQHHMPLPTPSPDVPPPPSAHQHTPTQPRHTATPSRSSTKRRQEFDDLEDDAAMDGGRSPSPADRPIRRLGGKKLRMLAPIKSASPEGRASSEESDAVDVGSLLASIPQSSLLPLLTSLLNERPELKPVVLNLIPRPALNTTLQAITDAAKKLRDAYPYAHNQQPNPSAGANAMRDSYVRTRLRQPVREFTRLLLSYMSYFSSKPPPPAEGAAGPSTAPASTPAGVQRPPAVPLHPTEAFMFLHAVTMHLLRFPTLTLAEFTRPTENIIFPRLRLEWDAWVQKLDDDVNRWAAMFGSEDVKSWERGLDELVVVEEQMSLQDGTPFVGMRAVRDRWVQRVGWLIGRSAPSIGMEI